MVFVLMKKQSMKTMIEISIVAFCVLFFVFSSTTYIPACVSSTVDSSFGMIIIFLIGIVLFVYMHPVVAIVYIVFAYDLIRRSTVINLSKEYPMLTYTSTEDKRDINLRKMNQAALAKQDDSLEEEVIAKMVPKSDFKNNTYLDTTFKPVAESVHSASLV